MSSDPFHIVALFAYTQRKMSEIGLCLFLTRPEDQIMHSPTQMTTALGQILCYDRRLCRFELR